MLSYSIRKFLSDTNVCVLERFQVLIRLSESHMEGIETYDRNDMDSTVSREIV